MADVTPPVGLASYAAAGISGGDPLGTGVQAFWYSLRTAILPIVFLFNHELLLIGIENIWHGLLVIITSLIGILVFTAATQAWFFNKMRWYEILVFLLISLAFLRPGFVLNKFYPQFDYSILQKNNLEMVTLKPDRDVHIKVTRNTDYGERYKLFVIKKNSFDENYSLKSYGVSLDDQEGKTKINTLDWKGLAKKDGIEMGDIITEFKIENLDRPSKAIVYPFALVGLLLFGYLNFKRKKNI
tara:strand:- start:9 stop:734 length:726 start_codon:yes stop_codon:yes gene_type:complete